jgi:hypothetical protein
MAVRTESPVREGRAVTGIDVASRSTPKPLGRSSFRLAKARRIEMEMRIVAGDSESACVLGDALTAIFGPRRVSFRRDDPMREVRIRGGSDPTVLRVLGAVDGWLNHGASRSAEMWLGERSYTLRDQAST